MAYQGRKVFQAGEVLTASDLNSTVDQTVMVFADTTARDTAIPTPSEGMIVYLESDNSVLKYDGSGWVSIALDTNLTADRVMITNGGGDLAVSDVTTTELNALDGITASASELNILDGATVTTAEVNKLDGLTATTTELNRVDGVTSNIQTQLNTLDSDKADLAGANFSGRVTASDNDESNFSVRNIYISTSDPSGGVDGDVWLKYE